MNPKEAKDILENVKQNAPERLVATCNSISAETPDWVLELNSRIRKTNERIDQLLMSVKKALVTIKGGEAVEEVASEAAESVASTPSRRMNKDGTEMSAEDAALEDMMDAASEGMPENSGGGVNATQVPKSKPATAATPAAAAATNTTQVATPPAVAGFPPSVARASTNKKNDIGPKA